jgi:putative membrane protein
MTGTLLIIGAIFVGIASLLHVVIFVLESVLWSRPQVFKRFGLRSAAEAETVRPMAFNQGFYNLFLAVAGFTGLSLLPSSHAVGLTLCLVAVVSMLLAAIVLISSSPKLARAAFIQGTAPLLAVILILLSIAIA